MAQLGDFLRTINTKGEKVSPDEIELDYVPFVVNRSLSYFIDTVMYADEMGKYPDCPKDLQYLFYYYGVRKNKRFSKWHKPENDKYLELIMEYYGYSIDKAKEALKILKKEQLDFIEQKLNKGGRK